MSPRGDVGQSIASFTAGTSTGMMPQMKGHHQFQPKDASTLLMQEESPSFFNQRGEEDRNAAAGGGLTNNRISDMIFKQERVPFDSNLDSAIEMHSMQMMANPN